MSFIDSRILPSGHRIEADLCVVGAGAAGLAMAIAFAGRSFQVALLESGGLNFDERTQALYEGEIVGRPHTQLSQTRLRYFGGSTNAWAGNVRPLDPIDFELRPWVPFSGWPFPFYELEPYYEQAREFLNLPDEAFDAQAWDDGKRYKRWQFERGRVTSRVFQNVTSENRQIGKTRREAIDKANNIETYLFANVLEIEAIDSRKQVRCLHAATLDGKRFKAYAKHFILATGGIENARLLLLTSNMDKAALGNRNGLVGRFFSNHLLIPRVCDLYPSDPDLNTAFYRPREHSTGHTTGVFSLADKVQREEKLLNLRFEIGQTEDIYGRKTGVENEGVDSVFRLYRNLKKGYLPNDFERDIANIIADVDNVAAYGYSRLRHYPDDPPLSHLSLLAIAEQSPNPDSRVALADELDRFGQRKVKLDWRLSELDTISIQRTVDILAQEVGASGLGRIRDFYTESDLQLIGLKPMNHHMGTTRMHNDSTKGVVDEDCRAHGLDNLFIAGSSVFPASGNANPTFTVLALAFRLCDHLIALIK